MDEDAIEPALDTDIKTLLTACFPEDRDTFARSRHWHGSAPAFSLVRIEGGRIVGHVGVVLRSVRWAGRTIPAAGIQSLAVAPSMRRTGLSRALMNEAMAEARRRGAQAGLLFCVKGLAPFYASLGWNPFDGPVTQRTAENTPAVLPAKNIAMLLPLGSDELPAGPLDIMGRDW